MELATVFKNQENKSNEGRVVHNLSCLIVHQSQDEIIKAKMEMSRAIDLQKEVTVEGKLKDSSGEKGLVNVRILGFRYFSYGILCYRGLVDTMMKYGFEQDAVQSKMDHLGVEEKKDLVKQALEGYMYLGKSIAQFDPQRPDTDDQQYEVGNQAENQE